MVSSRSIPDVCGAALRPARSIYRDEWQFHHFDETDICGRALNEWRFRQLVKPTAPPVLGANSSLLSYPERALAERAHLIGHLIAPRRALSTGRGSTWLEKSERSSYAPNSFPQR
jgi:hypothetical protein